VEKYRVCSGYLSVWLQYWNCLQKDIQKRASTLYINTQNNRSPSAKMETQNCRKLLRQQARSGRQSINIFHSLDCFAFIYCSLAAFRKVFRTDSNQLANWENRWIWLQSLRFCCFVPKMFSKRIKTFRIILSSKLLTWWNWAAMKHLSLELWVHCRVLNFFFTLHFPSPELPQRDLPNRQSN
jgi:hypothetical protein